METWKQLAAPLDRYDVSSLGRLRSRLKGRILRPSACADGYVRMPLINSNGAKKRTHYLHRLVASAFCAGNQSLTVNHKNLVKSDNRANNLEWVTFSENHKHANRLQPHRAAALSARMSKPIVRVSFNGERVHYPSLKAAAVALGNATRVANICRSLRYGVYAYGYNWEYATCHCNLHDSRPTCAGGQGRGGGGATIHGA